MNPTIILISAYTYREIEIDKNQTHNQNQLSP